MSTAAGGLKDLHQLHIELQKVSDQIDRGPIQIRARHNIVERKQAEIDSLKERLLALRKTADQKSLQMKTNESKLLDLQAKLNAASSNREFDIIKSRIDADTMATSVLEDEILEAYENVDIAQAQIVEAKEKHTAAIADEKRVTEEVNTNQAGLLTEKEQLETSLKTGEAILPPQVLQVYKRLVLAHASTALAPLENNACSACYSSFSANLLVELNVGKFVFCRSCGRLMYLQT